jgi:hypothetical protein
LLPTSHGVRDSRDSAGGGTVDHPRNPVKLLQNRIQPLADLLLSSNMLADEPSYVSSTTGFPAIS